MLDWLQSKMALFNQPEAPPPQIPLLAYGQPGQGDLPNRYATPSELAADEAARRAAPPLPQQPGMRLYPGGPLLREYIGPHATQGVESLMGLGNFMPVIGDAMSARDALTYGYDAATSGAQGDWGRMGQNLGWGLLAAIGAIPGAPNMASMFDNAANAADNAASAADNVATADSAGLLGAAARNWQSELDNMGGDWTRAAVIDDAGNVLHNPIGEWDGTGTRLAVRVMPDGSVRKGFIAYHGSPHDFDKFDLSKIGTGEGAQAYGHGLYFAENEGVARGYRDTLADRASTARVENIDVPKWVIKKIDQSPDKMAAIAEVRENFTQRMNEAIAEQQGSHQPWLAAGKISAIKDTLLALDKLEAGAAIPSTSGRMYEVQIDANPDDFLDWDKPLSEQPRVVAALKQLGFETAPAPYTNALLPSEGGTLLDLDGGGEGALRALATHRDGGYTQYDYAGASKQLEQAGIPGIKYLDAGSRGKGVAYVQPMYKGQPYGDPVPAHAWNQVDDLVQYYKAKGFDTEVKNLGTRNYVLFRDDLIKIIRKYGIAALALPGVAAMLANAPEAQASESP